MLRLGQGLTYVPDAVVVHSHRRSAQALYRRNYLGHRLLQRLFGLRAVKGVPHLLRATVSTCALDLRDLAYALRQSDVPRGEGLRAVLAGVSDFRRGRFGARKGVGTSAGA